MLSKQQKILLAVVLLCGWASVVWWYSFPSNIHNYINQKSEYTNTKDTASYYLILIILRHIAEVLNYYAAAVTAIATGFIAWFTYSLRNSTNIHAGHMEQMLGVTRAVERAYLYPIITADASVIKDYILECSVAHVRLDYDYKGEDDDLPADEQLSISFKIKNYGKTPATIFSVYADVSYWPGGSPGQTGLSVPQAILGDDDETPNLIVKTWKGLTRRQVGHINTYMGYLGLSGSITFADIWGKQYTTEFLFFWDKDIERMTLRRIHTKEEQSDET